MFDFLRDLLRRPKPHVHRRELEGLLACVVAWRRAVIELHLRDGVAEPDRLDERLAALASYAQGAGLADPFTTYILQIPVGSLDDPLVLEALYRMETAAAIAWALQLLGPLAPDEGAPFEAVAAIFPLDGGPAVDAAALRAPEEIAQARAEWLGIAREARARRDEAHTEAHAVAFSRAYERARGLIWVGGSGWIEDVVVEA